MQFNNIPLVVEQNIYVIKIVNTYIVYDLGNCPKHSRKIFTLKSCLFGATNIAKNNDKWNECIVTMEEHFMEKVSGILVMTQNAKNVVTCGVDGDSSSHSDNHKKDFLMLGKRDIFGINENFGAPKKKHLVLFLV